MEKRAAAAPAQGGNVGGNYDLPVTTPWASCSLGWFPVPAALTGAVTGARTSTNQDVRSYVNLKTES